MANDINLSLQQTQSRHNPSKAVFCYVPCHPCDIGRVLFIPLYFLVHRFFQLCFFSISQPGVVTAHSVCVVCLSQGQSHSVCVVCLGQGQSHSVCVVCLSQELDGSIVGSQQQSSVEGQHRHAGQDALECVWPQFDTAEHRLGDNTGQNNVTALQHSKHQATN